MNKFITPTTIIALLTMLCQPVTAAHQQVNQAGQNYIGPLLPHLIPIRCPLCLRPCGFMGLKNCPCYKERMAAQAAQKEAAEKEAKAKEAALRQASEAK